MLAGLEDDLQRRLGTCAFADGFRRELKRLAFGDPVLDVVQPSLATQLEQGPEVLGGVCERAIYALLSDDDHDVRF